jgi:NAD(P)-dependent dehydrogenase (short-subunit alcohol dehydrogenase family)
VSTSAGRFAGRVALVTGGGRGIGRAAALSLAAQGASVAVLARTAEQCAQTARDAGPGALAVACDVRDADGCAAALETIRGGLGRVDLVVHAAGISPVRKRAEQHEPHEFAHILDVNVAGAFNIVHAAAPQLLDGGGSVVLVASVLGLVASERLAAYGASKAALVHMARTLGREWAPRSVRVNAVCAGYVPTALTERMLAVDHIREGVLAGIPLGRLATIEEVVAPILFLASDDASYITGTYLLADGGQAA